MGIRNNFYADIMAFHPEVTGSCILVVVKYPNGNTSKFIVDCGLFQESKYSEYNNKLFFNADELDFALVTHNHVDHIGRLPFLMKNGFSKNIYMTNDTQKIIRLALSDSYKVLRGISKREHKQCLYSETDVERTLHSIVGCNYFKKTQVTPNISVNFLSNGHLIGAAMIWVQISFPEYEDINILFTGDYNNKNLFFDFLPVPKELKSLPLTIIQESTYGDMDSSSIQKCYEKNIVSAINEGKTVITPVFSLGRSQEILYVLKTLQKSGKLSDSIPVYFDGKLAIQYTNLYLKDEFNLNEDMKDFLPDNLTFIDKETRDNILYDNNPKIILTTSGMGSYGPAQTYIPAYLSRKNALIQFTGYTAEGTLGNRLKTTPKGETVEVGGLMVIKRADVEYTTEYSAHAKSDELISFLQQFEKLKLVLINHGETAVKKTYAEKVVKKVDTQYVGILGEEHLFRINPYGLVKTLTTKFK